MLDKKKEVAVVNRSNGTTVYEIPDLHLIRSFRPYEEKSDVTVEELQKLKYSVPGGEYILKNNLLIKDDEVLEALLNNVEPEYYYTKKDVDELILNGSLEQFLDALDFAPAAVIDMIKDECINLECNDIRKRQAVLEKTGFNITKTLAIKAIDESENEQPAQKERRANPINTTEDGTPARRDSKYNIPNKK